MESDYLIYLTRSAEAAQLIAAGLFAQHESMGYRTASHGPVDQDGRIPAIYHNSGYFCAIAERPTKEGHSPEYRLVIC